MVFIELRFNLEVNKKNVKNNLIDHKVYLKVVIDRKKTYRVS